MPRVFSEADFAPSNAETVAQPQARTFSDADFSGDVLPRYANGLTPATPINSSPISLEDRVKLSVGNESGKIKFLRETYGEVQRAKNGDLLIKDKSDGLWKRVDANGLGSGNAWEQTKEVLADIADVAPAAIKIGAQVGAQALLTAGTTAASVGTAGAATAPSLAAQAAVSGALGAGLEGIQTSLGRLAGTYDATPEEQLQDIGTELLLNAGGVYIAAGVMKGAKELPGLLAKAAKPLGGLGEAAKDTIALGRRVLNGVPEEQTKILLENGDDVARAMSRAQAGASTIEAQQQLLKEESIGAMKTIVDSVKATRQNIYNSIKDDLIEAVAKDPELSVNFKPDVTGALNVLNVLSRNGLGKFSQAIDPATGAAVEGGRVAFRASTAREIEEQFIKSGWLQRAVGLDKEKGMALIGRVAKDFENIANANYAKGVNGMKQVLEVDGMVRNLTDELFSAAEKYGVPQLNGLAEQIKQVASPAISSNFQFQKPVLLKSIQRIAPELQQKLGLQVVTANPLDVANNFYYQTGQLFRPLESAVAAGPAGFETLLNQVTASGTRNIAKKSAVETMAEVSKAAAPGIANNFNNALQAIRINGTAATHLNWARPGFTSTAGLGAAGALAGGSPLTAAGMVAAGAASSPRASYGLIRAGQKALGTLRSLSPSALKAAHTDPGFIQGLIGGILQAPAMQNQVTNQLMQQGVSAVRGQ